MKLSDNFVIREMAGVTVLLPLSGDFQGIMAVSPVGARILELLREETLDEGALCARICAEYDAPEEEIRKDVMEFLQELRVNKIIIEKINANC